MPFVLDASVAAAWALPDESTAFSSGILDRAGSDFAMAPSIWWYEIRNLLVLAERRNRILGVQSDQFLRRLPELNIRIANPGESATIMRLARAHNLTAYDAAYLELAAREHAALATLDRKLAAGATAEGITVLSG